jgi:hypothetical protein
MFLHNLKVKGHAFLKVLNTKPMNLGYSVMVSFGQMWSFLNAFKLAKKYLEASNMAPTITNTKCGEESEAHN